MSRREARREGRGPPIGYTGPVAAAVNGLVTLLPFVDGEFVRKFALYFIVGGICALIDWVVFSAIFYGVGLHYLIAGTLSFLIAAGVNYFLSVAYVFERGSRSRGSAIALVYLASTVGIMVNLAVLGGLIEYLSVHAMIAKIAGTGAAFGWNFASRYYWIFGR